MTIHPTESAAEEFAAAFDAYADDIFRHCYFRVYSRERAKELMQDAFMKLWEYVAAGNTVENVRALLYKIANNLVIDEARRSKKRTEVSFEDLQEEGFDIAGDDGRDEGVVFDSRQVASVMYTIEEPYRTALVMRYIDEMKPKEIADTLGETANVISVRINRGLTLLRGQLPDYG